MSENSVDNKRPLVKVKKYSHKRLLILLILALLFIVVVVVLLLLKKDNDNNIDTSESVNVQAKEQQYDNYLKQYNAPGNDSEKINESINKLNEIINSEYASEKQKIDAYNLSAIYYYRLKDYDKSLDIFLEMESLYGGKISYSVYSGIAGIYEIKGDKQKAIEYYKKSIEVSNSTPEPSDNTYNAQTEQRIQELSR